MPSTAPLTAAAEQVQRPWRALPVGDALAGLGSGGDGLSADTIARRPEEVSPDGLPDEPGSRQW